MVPVPLQVGVSLGFKGTGGGRRSKSQKRKNTNKTLKQSGRLNARGLELRFTPPVYESPAKAGKSNGASIRPAQAFCIASPSVEDRHQKEKERGGAFRSAGLRIHETRLRYMSHIREKES